MTCKSASSACFRKTHSTTHKASTVSCGDQAWVFCPIPSLFPTPTYSPRGQPALLLLVTSEQWALRAGICNSASQLTSTNCSSEDGWLLSIDKNILNINC